MAIDFSKYSAGTIKKIEKWEPPISELEQQDKSSKLALSSRCYPEYLLAAYAHLTETHAGLDIDSISNLVYTIICQYINDNREEIGELPDPETAIEFLISRGWTSADNAENFKRIAQIQDKQQRLQERVDSGKATDKERYTYWKHRDPEKAEAILERMTQQVVQDLNSEDSPPENTSYKQDDSEVDEKHKEQLSFNEFAKAKDGAGIADADVPDTIPVKEEN